ncbi:PEP-CTERM sorting domain-containing protein [Lacipirellula sp.]|uniref:PEP-CTERM sorting domain-containing protein n=1 Tax=Lacipirellula sp. TaxID=2691419 RepID=UPI003D143A6C
MRWNMFALAAALIAAAASPLHAHGPQIQLTAEAGKIVTRQVLIDDYVPVSPATSLYVLPVVNVSSQWLVQPPGTAGSGPGIAVGVGFVDAASHPFKTGNYTTSIVDGLKKWNGASFVDAGVTQLQLYKTVSGNPLTATTADVGPFASLAYSLSVTDEEAHTGMGYRFLGDGSSNTSTLADGVYLLSLKVSAAGLTDSAPFYFVLPKGVTPSEAGAATLAFAQQQGIAAGAIQAMTAIPEPASLALAGLALICLGVASRRRGSSEA